MQIKLNKTYLATVPPPPPELDVLVVVDAAELVVVPVVEPVPSLTVTLEISELAFAQRIIRIQVSWGLIGSELLLEYTSGKARVSLEIRERISQKIYLLVDVPLLSYPSVARIW